MAVASPSPAAAEVLQPLSPRNTPAATGNTRLTATVPARLERGIRDLAESEEIPISEVIRKALRAYLREKEQNRNVTRAIGQRQTGTSRARV